MIELRAPVIIVNFKGYPEVEGAKATALASICEDVARRTGAAIIVCPPMVELSKVASSVAIPVFAQHVDAKAPGLAGWLRNLPGYLTHDEWPRMIIEDLGLMRLLTDAYRTIEQAGGQSMKVMIELD